MNPQERKIIDNLFDKLGHAELQASPREPVAEAHIRSHIDSQPAAPYLMAQTIVARGRALGAAQTALGVTGGILFGSMIGGAFGGDEAQAAQASEAEHAPADDVADDGADFGGDEF